LEDWLIGDEKYIVKKTDIDADDEFNERGKKVIDMIIEKLKLPKA
jgi:hypothetical protein